MAILVACTTSTPGYRIPDRFEFSFRWSAVPGIVLTSDAAVIARAYMESAFISYRTDPTGNPWPTPDKFSYPGYDRAAPQRGKPDMRLDGMSMPFDEPRDTHTLGTFYAHVLELKPDDSAHPPESQSQSAQPTWHAVMCVWVDGLDLKSSPAEKDPFNGQYHPFVNVSGAGTLPDGGRTVRLAMQPPPTGQPTRLSAGEGPARYPTTDVFGHWKITDAKMTDPGTNSHGEQNLCADRPDNPVPAALRGRDSRTGSDVPAPTLDPYPGWPGSKQ
ncbi:hypothetical protein [Nocardia niigatensis]|uniref:hypothetical protein n=1 Tax=Nocardia niigatensis TaxID=209249 RepID=UPI0012F6B839|nr:hypothetical protein [Nocardia niigatensis]